MEKGPTGAGENVKVEQWQKLTPGELRSNTVSFPAVSKVAIAEYLDALESQGFESIISLQVCSSGICRLTLGDEATARSFHG